MKAIRAILKDRKRSQRGSVLSGVLIITAFLAIIAGGLMTELSSSFLLSRAQMHRVDNEATVNSAVEVTLDQLQRASINSGCPSPGPATINSQTAVATYLSCHPTVDSRSPQYRLIATSAPFTVEGTHAVVASPGGDEYLIGDSAGNFFRFAFGRTTPWELALGGRVMGPALATPDGTTILVPVSGPTAPGSPGCGAAGTCVAAIDWGQRNLDCYIPSSAPVTSRPAAGINFATLAYFGDSNGTLIAYDTASEDCVADASVSLSQAVVAGPVVFPGPVTKSSRADEVYVVTSDLTGSHLEHYEYAIDKRGQTSLNFIENRSLSAAQVSGLAADEGTARIAITFAGGAVEMIQLQSPGMPVLAQANLPSGIASDPFWCHCPGPSDVIGVGGQNGTLYLLSTSLAVNTSISVGAPISTSPAADGAGDWFVAADNGNLNEVPAIPAAPTLVTIGPGQLGRIQSSVQVGPCGAWICAYLGSSNSKAYTVQFDARDVVLSASITSSPAANPHLWASFEIGSSSRAQTVHVQGWSYYSP